MNDVFRIGFGNDTHRLVAGQPLIIGGVRVESDVGAEGHSDADVLMHAVTDAIFGALAEGDMGTHFPSSEDRWRNAESSIFLRFAVGMMHDRGYVLGNLDSVVALEEPKLRPYIEEMRANLAMATEVETNCISVKAKTGENVGPVGNRLAVTAEAIVLIAKS